MLSLILSFIKLNVLYYAFKLWCYFKGTLNNLTFDYLLIQME